MGEALIAALKGIIGELDLLQAAFLAAIEEKNYLVACRLANAGMRLRQCEALVREVCRTAKVSLPAELRLPSKGRK